MHSYTAVVEKDNHTGLYAGFVPGLHGVHYQGATLDELGSNLREVITMLPEGADD